MSTSYDLSQSKAYVSLRKSIRAADVSHTARQCLQASSYRTLHHIECDGRGGHVTLRGQVASYFLKQMAQELVGGLSDVTTINNQIEVVPGTRDSI